MMVESYIREMLLAMLLVLPLYLVGRWWFVRRKKERVYLPRELLLALFVLFMISLATQVFRPGWEFVPSSAFAQALQRVQTGGDINLVPLRTIRGFFRVVGTQSFLVNIVGNIVLFMPLGFCLPLLWRRFRAFSKTLLAGFLFSLTIETVQLFISRYVDVDDLILNTAAAVLGYGLARAALAIWPRLDRLAKGKK